MTDCLGHCRCDTTQYLASAAFVVRRLRRDQGIQPSVEKTAVSVGNSTWAHEQRGVDSLIDGSGLLLPTVTISHRDGTRKRRERQREEKQHQERE